MVAAPKVVHIAERGSLPQFTQDQERSQHQREQEQSQAKVLEIDLVLRFDVVPPTPQVALVKIQEHALLAEWKHQAGGLFELCGQGVEFALLLLEAGDFARVGLLGQLIAALN